MKVMKVMKVICKVDTRKAKKRPQARAGNRQVFARWETFSPYSRYRKTSNFSFQSGRGCEPPAL